MKKLIALLLACALALMAACSAPVDASQIIDAKIDMRSKEEILKDYNACAEDIASINQKLRSISFKIAQGFDNASYVYSPYSLYTVLGAIAEGASDNVEKQIYDVLAPEGMTIERFRQCIKLNCEYLMASDTDVIDINNLAVLSDELEYDSGFADIMGKYYNMSLSRGDIGSQETMERINAWAREKTNGMIDPFLTSPLEPDASFALLNSLYFSGSWEQPFDEAFSKRDTFYGTSKNYPTTFLTQTTSYSYASCDDYSSVILPYESGAEMRVYLPAEGKTTQDVINAISSGDNASYSVNKVNIRLPKFDLQSSFENLADELSKIGLEVMCDESSSPFDNIAKDTSLYLTLLIQKAKIEVSEEGTRAAAVTMAEMDKCTSLVDPRKPVDFIVDHPFVYTIEKGGTVLFLGMMNELPTEA